MSHCVACGKPVPKGGINCEVCGELLAGTRRVAVEPLRQEAMVAYGLLRSAGFQPVLAFLDESGEPHSIDPEASFIHGAGLMVPVNTAFGVYVPEEEAPEALAVLEDARRSGAEAGQDRGHEAGQD